ncbi:hypothetical protein MLD38_022363 [Melastoma candidum]|uniref:Uncharacterized protein n=1 Tax=Melastoma candidum TaxID=119954 RepID=A0ACB9QIX3_9MYRT|nr:hypothetical protein MLD38_022363 [Melastoma candidum]
MLHKSNLQFSIDGSRSSRVLGVPDSSANEILNLCASPGCSFLGDTTFLGSRTRLNSGLRRVDLLLKREMRDK